MSLSPVPVESFGGLNLLDDPGTVGWNGAIDLLNVDFDRGGRIRSRAGTTRLGNATGNVIATWDQPFSHFITTDGTNLRTYSNASALITTYATNKNYNNAASLGTGAAGPYLYIGGDETAQIIRYDGANVTAPGGMPNARFVAVTPWDNRLVAAYTSTSTLSRVSFSDPGAPETWGANNYIDLLPNDGEYITGMTTFGNELFVFKGSKVFVFYGTSPDGTGNPIFNYRAIETGTGIYSTTRPYVTTPQGVYFASQDGIYRTTGGPPELVSRALDPLFRPGLANAFFSSGSNPTFTIGGPWTFYNQRIYAKATLGSTASTIVYDLETGQWNLWQIANAGALYPLTLSGGYRLIHSDGSSHVDYLDPAATTDDGTAITSRYRSGFSDLGSPDMKRIHSWRAVGSGTPTLKLSTDFGALETGAAMTLGTAPAIAEAVRRYAPRGRRFSWELSGTSAFSVNAFTAYAAGKRKSGEHVAA